MQNWENIVIDIDYLQSRFSNEMNVSFTITSSTGKVSTRAKGRQIGLKFQSTGTTDDWTLGDFRVNSRQDGLR